mmetsp:Transcript_81216/g.159393  ORF Transcript_81216/g.159393 Transcript_81216/m.159393 type:complete len:421 (-) Transcript_81216:224-1486(-)
MAKGKGGKGTGGVAKGSGAARGGADGGRKSGGKGGKGSKDAGFEEKVEGGPAARMASKAYKSALDDVTGNTQVKVSDFDIKAVHLLDYLQKSGNRAGEALTYLKKAAQGVQRDDILNWRAYVYTLLRKFDENAYKAMKAQSTDRVANNKAQGGAGGDASARAGSTPPPLPAGALGDGTRPQGDASTRQPPAPPPLQDYLAQAGFFSHPPGPPAPPPPATPAPGAQDLELSAKAKEFVPGKTWDGRLVGCTPQVPMYPPTMPGYYPPPYYPGYPGYGYPGVPPVAPPYPATMPPVGADAKKGSGQRRGGAAGGKKGKGALDRSGPEGKGASKESKAPADGELAEATGTAAADGEQKDASAGQPPMWSVGSAGHEKQECKPCAFYHTKGCSSGEQCQFCHMCGPGEKKKRKKEAVTPKESQK